MRKPAIRLVVGVVLYQCLACSGRVNIADEIDAGAMGTTGSGATGVATVTGGSTDMGAGGSTLPGTGGSVAVGGVGGSAIPGITTGSATGTTTGTGGSSVGTGGGSIPQPVGTLLGEWTGHVQQYRFDDASNAVTMTVASLQGALAGGNISFGEKAMYAAPTDSTVGYPPGLDSLSLVTLLGHPSLVAGFAYTMQGATFDGHRLEFKINPHELWEKWCMLQTPIESAGQPGTYAAWPAWTGGFSWTANNGCSLFNLQTQQNVPVDCLWFESAASCTCSAQSCGASPSGLVTFSVLLSGDQGDGTLSSLNVHLQHVP